MRGTRSRTLPVMALGTLVALAPTDVLQPIAGEEWEIALLRLIGGFTIAIGALWSWAALNAGRAIRPVVVAAWLLTGVYALSGNELSLFVAFCALAAVAANLGAGRVLAVAEEARRRLDIADR